MLLQLLLEQLGVALENVRVYTSPFSRTIQTAELAAAAAGISADNIQVCFP